jgi:AraC-like DNA-binding protein
VQGLGGRPQDSRGILRPEEGAAHFRLERRSPAEDLRDVVDRHWIVRWREQRPPPDPGVALQRYRLHEAAERIAAGEATGLAALALELGYFDQAHFGNDFRRYVGVPPAVYAA